MPDTSLQITLEVRAVRRAATMSLCFRSNDLDRAMACHADDVERTLLCMGGSE
jgi:hypothetical protein